MKRSYFYVAEKSTHALIRLPFSKCKSIQACVDFSIPAILNNPSTKAQAWKSKLLPVEMTLWGEVCFKEWNENWILIEMRTCWRNFLIKVLVLSYCFCCFPPIITHLTSRHFDRNKNNGVKRNCFYVAEKSTQALIRLPFSKCKSIQAMCRFTFGEKSSPFQQFWRTLR